MIKNCVFNPGFHHGGRRVCGRGMLKVKYEEKNSALSDFRLDILLGSYHW